MPADIVGSVPLPDGSPGFLVRDQETGTTAPATLAQLAPYPDLAAQAQALAAPPVATMTQDPNGGMVAPPSAAAAPAMVPNPAGGMMAAAMAPTEPPLVRPNTDQLAAMGKAGVNFDPGQTQLSPQQLSAISNAGLPLSPDQIGAAQSAPTPAAAPVATGNPPAPPAPLAPGGPPGGPPPAPAGAGLPRAGVPRGPAAPGPTVPMDPTAGNAALIAGKAGEVANTNTAYDDYLARQDAANKALSTNYTADRLAGIQGFNNMMDLKKQALDAQNAIDPNKFWSDKSMLGNIMFRLSAGLVGAAGGWAGKPTAGVDYVNAKIKQNVDMQEKKADALGKFADAQDNVVQHYRQLGMDDVAAHTSAIASNKEFLANSIANAANKLGPNGVAPALQSFAGTLKNSAAVDWANVKAKYAATGKDLADAAAARAMAGKTGAEAGLLRQNLGAEGTARADAANKAPIPLDVRLKLPPEVQKNITSDGYWLPGEGAAEASDKASANLAPHEASIQHFLALAKGTADPNLLSDSAQEVHASTKLFYGLPRGAEGDKGLPEVAPGIADAFGANVKWADPYARVRAIAAATNQLKTARQRTSAEMKVHGHPGLPGTSQGSPGAAQ